MPDSMLSKGIGGDFSIRSEQTKCAYGDSPKKRTLPGTHGAVALNHLVDLAFDLKGDLCAMTAAFVSHLQVPSAVRQKRCDMQWRGPKTPTVSINGRQQRATPAVVRPC